MRVVSISFLILLYIIFFNNTYSYNVISNKDAEFLIKHLVNKKNYKIEPQVEKHIKSIFPDLLTADYNDLILFFSDIEKVISLSHSKTMKSSKYKIINYANNALYSGLVSPLNQRHYFGRYLWDDGNEYIGGFFEGNHHFLGLYKWPSGGKFFGFWKNDEMKGLGIYIRNDGVIYYGYWTEDHQDDIGVKFVPVRTCEGENKVSAIETVFLENWKNRVLLGSRILRPHLGIKLKEFQNKKHFTDIDIVCQK